jgi:hypothetical protein
MTRYEQASPALLQDYKAPPRLHQDGASLVLGMRGLVPQGLAGLEGVGDALLGLLGA